MCVVDPDVESPPPLVISEGIVGEGDHVSQIRENKCLLSENTVRETDLPEPVDSPPKLVAKPNVGCKFYSVCDINVSVKFDPALFSRSS
jgi:hypothetical protein